MAKFKMSWEPNAFALAGVLGRLPTKIRQTAMKGINTIADQALADLKGRTPGKDLPKGWAAEKSQTPAQYKIVLRNTDARAYKPVVLNDGRRTNLIEMLEYGTRPHEITPKRARRLRFVADGRTVFTKSVYHPGTRPYAMVRYAEIRAIGKIAKLQFALAKMIDKEAAK